MKKLFRIATLTVIVSLLITMNGGLNFEVNSVQAAGDLTINWGPGLSEGDPIFVVTGMAPGQMETRVVGVTNSAPSPRTVGVRGIHTDDSDSLSSQLDIVITEGVDTRYSNTLAQFFIDSGGPDGIFLSSLNTGISTNYNFKVTFNQDAGNSWQDKSVVFDLKIGISMDLPAECDLLDLMPSPIIGSSKAETLNGTPGNDLIMGLEGADRINGRGGNDCILGGTGADTINGDGGGDVLFGEAHADSLNGGDGDDLLIGAGGADTMKGGSGNDTLRGGQAWDTAQGGAGTDSCEAESRSGCELP